MTIKLLFGLLFISSVDFWMATLNITAMIGVEQVSHDVCRGHISHSMRRICFCTSVSIASASSSLNVPTSWSQACGEFLRGLLSGITVRSTRVPSAHGSGSSNSMICPFTVPLYAIRTYPLAVYIYNRATCAQTYYHEGRATTHTSGQRRRMA